MAQRLDYLTFYRGNFATGYDYFYLKRQDGHAFLHFEPKGAPVLDVTDGDFDYYNPHYSQDGTPFTWRYREAWTDLSKEWDALIEELLAIIDTWLPEYHGPSFETAADNDEWGVRFKRPGQVDDVIWGLNAFPGNLADFQARLETLK